METSILTGTLTSADHKSHVPIPFDVPPGTTAIEATFHAAPDRAPGALFDNLISLAVEGPAGFRGARHNNPDRRLRIDAHAATPGFHSGPIEPGRWTVWLDVFRLLGPVAWRLEVTLHTDPLPEPAPRPAPSRPADRGPGWYRGDLHAHSFHSDTQWSPEELAAWAVRNRLDFATLSDHNTTSGIAAFEAAAGDRFLAIGGVELTTHFGHALVLGTRRWEEWRAGSLPGITMADIARGAIARGQPFVIAHPMSPGDPSCTGCRWEHDDVRPGPVLLVEVWNGPWSDYNEEGLAVARRWAAEAWATEGKRMAYTAGTDLHGPDGSEDTHGFNLVHAERFSEEAILEGILSGRTVLSSGPRLYLDASPASAHPASHGDPARSYIATWGDAPDGAVLSLFVDGRPAARHVCGPEGTLTLDVETEGPRTVEVELRDDAGTMLALTSPLHDGRP